MRIKKYQSENVLDAARKRISIIFDEFEKIYCSFSGGKDSSVMMHLLMDEAKKRNRKIGVLFIDLEAQYKDTIDNPFSSDERIKMITDTLEKNKIKNFKIVLIPDIHNPPKWVNHVLSIISDFDVVLTNNSFTKSLFLEKGYKVEKTPLFNKEEFCGSNIRKRISDNEPWEKLVPSEVAKIIKENNGVERIQKLSKN